MEGATVPDGLRLHRERHQKICMLKEKYKDAFEFDPIKRNSYRITNFAKKYMFPIPVNITEDQMESIPGAYRYRILLNNNNLKNKKPVKTSKLVDFTNVKVPKKKDMIKPKSDPHHSSQLNSYSSSKSHHNSEVVSSVTVNTKPKNNSDDDPDEYIMNQIIKESMQSYKDNDADLDSAIMASLGNIDKKSNNSEIDINSNEQNTDFDLENIIEESLKNLSEDQFNDKSNGVLSNDKLVEKSSDSDNLNANPDIEKIAAEYSALKDKDGDLSDLEKAISESLKLTQTSVEPQDDSDIYKAIKASMKEDVDPYDDELERVLEESKKENMKKDIPKVDLNSLEGLSDDMKIGLTEGINEFLKKNPDISNVSVNGKKGKFPEDSEIDPNLIDVVGIEGIDNIDDEEALLKAIKISKKDDNSEQDDLDKGSSENDPELDKVIEESNKYHSVELEKALEESKKLHQQQIDKVVEESKKQSGIALDLEDDVTMAVSQTSIAHDEALARAISASLEITHDPVHVSVHAQMPVHVPVEVQGKYDKIESSPKKVILKDPSSLYVCLDLRVYGPIPTQSIFVGETEYCLTVEQCDALKQVWTRVDPDSPSGERYNQDRIYDKIASHQMLLEKYY